MDLVGAKLRKPGVPEDAIQRRRLTDRIASSGRRNVLLVAPVGYGKTVLMTQIRLARDETAVWYRLDETDNAFRQFIHYLSAAFEPCFPGASQMFSDLLSVPPDDLRPDVAAGRFLGLVDDATGRITLFLDDVHVIRSDAVRQFLRYLAEYAGRALRIVMAADIPVPVLADLPLERRYIEFVPADLRFSREETERFLGSRDAASRARRLEGWPFGLALLKRHGYEALREETGALADRILAALDPAEREILSVPAHFPHATPALCEAVLGERPDPRPACEILDDLLSRGVFLTATGDTYDLHPLIGDTLCQRFPLTPDRQTAALDALVRAGRHAQAMGIALESGDTAQASRILRASRYALLSLVWADRLRYFHSLLPDPVLETHPDLRLLAAAEALLRGDPSVFGHLEAARRHFEEEDNDDGLVWAGLLASAAHRRAHRYTEAAADIEAVFERASLHPAAQVDLVLEIAALTDTAWPAMDKYAPWREKLYRTLDERVDDPSSLRLLSGLALWLARDSRPEKAWNVHKLLSSRHGDYGVPAEVLLARYRSGGIEEAAALFEEALHREDLDGEDPRREGRVLFLYGLGLCRRMAGSSEDALQLFSRGRQEALSEGDTTGALRCDLEYIKTLCLQGYWDRGMGLAYEARLGVAPNDPAGMDIADATLATLSCLHGLNGDADEYANSVLRRAGRGRAGYPMLEASLVLAAIAAAEGDDTRAATILGGVSAQLLPLATAWLREHAEAFAPLLRLCRERRLISELPEQAPGIPAEQEAAVPAVLSVHCFGNTVAESGGLPVRWRTRKARDLFFFLVLHRGLKKSRAGLVEAIFPEASEEQLVHQVKNTLSVLRHSLEQAGFPDMVMAAGGYYWLNEARIESDFDRFRQLIHEAAAADRDTRAESVREACRIHQGELCRDMEFIPLPRLRVQIAGQLESALLTVIQEQVGSRSLINALFFTDELCRLAPDNAEYLSIRQALRSRISTSE
ncbi:MAG: hypothetical protein KBA30_08965 [Clostridia bacterium]|nr:hypothetical protein [Clostridia bacterium]